MSQYMLRRYHQRRAAALEALGNECCKCGSVKNLHFHHKDETTKIASLGTMFLWAEARVQAELAKCELLCEECQSFAGRTWDSSAILARLPVRGLHRGGERLLARETKTTQGPVR